MSSRQSRMSVNDAGGYHTDELGLGHNWLLISYPKTPPIMLPMASNYAHLSL